MYYLNLLKYKNLHILLTTKYLILINNNGIIKFKTNFYNILIKNNNIYFNFLISKKNLSMLQYNNSKLNMINTKEYLNFFNIYLLDFYNNLFYLNLNYMLQINLKGIGYKFIIEHNYLKIRIGYSHFIKIILNPSIYYLIKNQTNLILYGNNKYLIQKILSVIHLYKKTNLYKGTGIQYNNELIILKKKNKNKNVK